MDNPRQTLPQPLVSIGLPVYNGARFLTEALDSLLAQSFTNFEVIICDNASSDKTPEICHRYLAADQRIRYYRNAKNIGAARNFNRTFKLSKGKYFKWFAHDDQLAPDYLKRCVDVLEHAPKSVSLCFPRVQYINAHNDPTTEEGSLRIQQTRQQESYHQISFRRLLQLSPACYPIFAFGLARTQTLRETRLIGPYVLSDLIVVAELRLLGEFIEIPERLYFQRIDQQDPTRKVRNSVQGEALWYSPTNRNRRFYFPYSKLFWEYLRAIQRLTRGSTQKAKAYIAVLGFTIAALKRGLHHYIWQFWSIVSVGVMRISGYTTLPVRLWCLLAALRYWDKDKVRVAFAGPWHRTPPALLRFGAQRLAHHKDDRALATLLAWSTGSHPERCSAAMEALADIPKSATNRQK